MKPTLLIFTLLMVNFTFKAQEITEDLPPGWWKIPKSQTRIIVGGYVKVDMIHDFNPIGNTGYFDCSTIPLPAEKGTNSKIQANEARLIFDAVTDVEKTQLETYVEGDFFGANGTFRLRHAFVEIDGRLLAGQTWSNFMDEDIIPQDLDLEKPNAFAFVRQAMVRYKQPIGKSSYLSVALEVPTVDVQEPTQPGKVESFVPDLTARYRMTKNWGHVQLSGYGGMYRFLPSTGTSSYTAIYGANLSGLFNFYKQDIFLYQVIAGQGIAQFRSGVFMAPNSNDQLEAIPGYGVTASIRHYWTPKFSTILVGNYGEDINTSGQVTTATNAILYATVSCIWQFNKMAFVGIEYLHGSKSNAGGQIGYANRLQMSLSVTFNNRSPYFK